MRVLAGSLAVLALSISPQAVAADKKTGIDQKERMVCRTLRLTGTRFEKRVCKTADQWEKIAQGHNDEYREQLARPVINRAAQP